MTVNKRNEPPGLTRQAKLACVRRELTMRLKVYPGMVKRGRMTKDFATREIELMRAIVADYEQEFEDDINRSAIVREAIDGTLEVAATIADGYDKSTLTNVAPMIALNIRAVKARRPRDGYDN